MTSTMNNIKMPPTHLILSSEKDIRIPFSSPIGDEILSPTSPTAPLTPIRSRRKDHNDEGGHGNSASRNRRFSVQKSPKRDSARKPVKSQNKARWPGLNVVTNFSKPPILAQRAAEEDVRHESRRNKSSEQIAQHRFTSLSDIKTPVDSRAYGDLKTPKRNKNYEGHILKLDGELIFRVDCDEKQEHDSSAGLGLHPFDSPPDYGSLLFVEGKSQVSSLKRSSTRMTELSPSDRPIMIGITVPSAKFAELSISPDVGPTSLTTPNMTNRDPPITPTIIVTPAKDQGPWSSNSFERNQTTQNQQRAPSSVYSQLFQHSRGVNRSTDTPPVPVPPPEYFASKHARDNRFDDDGGKPSPSRVVSSYTVFDEDDVQGRPTSGESHQRILKRSSTDSIATRHRSQGWWNHVLSPFITCTNTMIFKVSTSEEGGPVPPLPAPTQGGTARKQSATSSNEISPLESKPEDFEKNRASHWTDFSRFEAEHQKIGLAFDHTPGASTLILDPSREMENTGVSDTPVPFEGFGAAAEYFHACWHDQNSLAPYFDCQNHSCWPSKTDQPIAFDLEGDIKSINNPNAPRDLAEIEMHRGQKGGFQQVPANPFSAAFSQAANSKPRERSLSEVTDIEDLDATPEVHEAHVAPIVRAHAPTPTAQIPLPSISPRMVVSDSSSSNLQEKGGNPPSSQTPRKPSKRFVAVMPPNEPLTREQPSVPQTSSLSQSGRVPRKPIPAGKPSRENESVLKKEPTRTNETSRGNVSQPQNTYIVNHYYDSFNRRLQREEVRMAEFEPPPHGERRGKWSRERREKREKREKDEYNRERKKRKCCGTCFQKDKPMTKKKKRLLIGVAISLIILIILILALAMTLTGKGDKMHVQTQWLNLSGFPPIPTGISTIIQPDVDQEYSGCVEPATIWSCALPKEVQQLVAPNDANQPNFMVEIKFRNGTSTNGTSGATGQRKRSQIPVNPVSAGHFIRHKVLQIRDSFINSIFSPNPDPPSQEDQEFLGNTTDKNAVPFDGESTPFFMTFLDPFNLPTSQRLLKRATNNNNNNNNNTSQFPDSTRAIPPPDLNPDGTAASPNLLPLPSSQPLRLYNRGLPTEHYGFYTYYDRSIFLKSTSLLDSNTSTAGEVPDDLQGGAPQAAATVRCTWAQTRFLVQIWTNQLSTPLLPSASASPSTTPPPPSQNLTTIPPSQSHRPGSFAYPVTLTLDRHGGDPLRKLIYCYGLDAREHVLLDRQKIQLETRDAGAGGELVNPSRGQFGPTKVGKGEGGPGGIDGGKGGCVCRWRNFGG